MTLRGISKEIISEIYNEAQLDEKEDIKKIMPKLEKKEKEKKLNIYLEKDIILKIYWKF